MGFASNNTDPALVEKVQNLQRSDPNDGKLKWMSYALMYGDGKYDPRAHSNDYINSFFADLESGNIEIDASLKSSSGPGPIVTNELFVGNLPQSVEENEIRDYFCGWGEIKRIDYKPERGFCFVTFNSQSEAETVLAHHAEHMIRGQWVDCKNAEDRRKGGNKGGKGGFSKGGNKGFSKGFSKGGKYDGGFSKGFSKGGKNDGGFSKGFSKGGKSDKGFSKGSFSKGGFSKGGKGDGYGPAPQKWGDDNKGKGKGFGGKGFGGKGFGGKGKSGPY